ncbi:MAG: IS110 family transposase [Dehalococcoidia bacterium]|nr:IS110 family transposase [Dehalococcoidia bacterium]MBF8303802.1 family transposase [Dehalococcoidia bacterium]
MQTSKVYTGIDVSKTALDVAVYGKVGRHSFTNSEQGISQLVSWLKRLNPEIVVMEATGGLETPGSCFGSSGGTSGGGQYQAGA